MRQARKLAEQSLLHDETVLVSVLVLLESEWVLRSRYRFKRETVVSIFRALLESREVSFEDEPAFEEALFPWEGQRLRVFGLHDYSPQSADGLPGSATIDGKSRAAA